VRSVDLLSGFNHFDFIWGERAPTLVYAQIVRAIVTDFQQGQNVSGYASSSA
jgi:hypothetical protein